MFVADLNSSMGESGDERSSVAEPLRRWERALALTIGFISAVVAGVALFRSGNQAGTAAFTLVATAFLLIGVQGTALVRMGGSSGTVELERRRRVAYAVERAQDLADTEPDVARGILEGIALVEPSAGPVAGAVLAMRYEQAVRRALTRVLPSATTTEATPPADLKVVAPQGAVIVSVSYRRSQNLQTNDLSPLVGSRDLAEAVGGVVVTNRSRTPGVDQYIATAASHGLQIEVVTWNSDQDDLALIEAFARLLDTSRDRPGV